LAGYRNEKSFIRAFRTWMGMSPTEFRGSSESERPHRKG